MKIREKALEGEIYKPLFVDALGKVLEGIVTLEEVNKKLVLFQ